MECPLPASHAVIMEYMNLPQGMSRRIDLERRYGKQVTLKLMKDYVKGVNEGTIEGERV